MLWYCYVCDTEHEDTPLEALKDGKVYWWALSAEVPDYPYVIITQVKNFQDAEEWLINEGYAPQPVAPIGGPE